MLVSRCKVTDKNLSKYQLNQMKEKRQNNNSNYNSQSEKLIPNLGNDSTVYMNSKMYKMMRDAGYHIKIKKILEFEHKEIFKDYIEFLYSLKKKYSSEKKKAMTFCIKILMNSFYGSTLINKLNFKDIRICTTKRQAMKFTKLPNFHSFKIINKNLIIIQISKNKCIFDSPVMIGLRFYLIQNVIFIILCMTLFQNCLVDQTLYILLEIQIQLFLRFRIVVMIDILKF